MMFRTHLAIGILTSILIHQYFHTDLLFSLALIISTSLPDIDHQGSWIGRRLWLFSKLINLIFGHRGMTHSSLVPFGFLVLSSYYGYATLGIAVAIGYVTHIFADSFTSEGVKIAYPFSKRIYSGPIKTNGIAEFAIFSVLVIAIGIKIIS